MNPWQSSVQSKYMRKRLMVLGGLILLAVVAIIATNTFLQGRQSSGAEKVATDFIAAVSNGDVDKSFQLLSTNAQNNDPKDTSWSQYVARLNITFVDEDPTLASESVSGKTVNLRYNIPGNDNQSYHLLLTMVQENGWRVDSFTSGQN